MKKYLFNYFLLALFLMSGGSSTAQKKNIVISDALSENAEMMKVKMGTQWMGKMWKIRFGDYSISKNKLGWTKINQKSNLLSTKIETKIGYKFNFELNNNTSESAIVNAVYSENIKELQSIELFPHFYVGSDMVLKDSLNFTANISLSSNLENTWNLYMKKTSGFGMDFIDEGILTYEERVISIIFVTSIQENNDKRMLPAMGYEFTENGMAICAMQYYGGGALGLNKNIIWIDSTLNQGMKLIVAAAMTSILEMIYDDIGKLNNELMTIYMNRKN